MSEKSISESGRSASLASLRLLAGVSGQSAYVLRTSLLITLWETGWNGFASLRMSKFGSRTAPLQDEAVARLRKQAGLTDPAISRTDSGS